MKRIHIGPVFIYRPVDFWVVIKITVTLFPLKEINSSVNPILLLCYCLKVVIDTITKSLIMYSEIQRKSAKSVAVNRL